MEAYWRHLITTLLLLGGGLGWIVGLISGWKPFVQNIPFIPKSWREHPQATGIACIVVVEVGLMMLLWLPVMPTQETHHETLKPSTSEPSHRTVPEPPQFAKAETPIVNEQAEKMSREFMQVFATITTKPLSEYERSWYSEYLSAVMSAKIETICGRDECVEYERLLTKLKSGSKDLQHHFRGVEPFVTRKRFMQSQTPIAGPVIELAATAKAPSVVEKALSGLAEEPAPATQAAHTEAPKPELLIADAQTTTNPRSDQAKPSVTNNPEADIPQLVLADDSAAPKTSRRVEDFVNKPAWVTCRKCGQDHQMTFGYFAHNDHHICAKCGATMSTVAFSAKIAKEMKRITDDMAR